MLPPLIPRVLAAVTAYDCECMSGEDGYAINLSTPLFGRKMSTSSCIHYPGTQTAQGKPGQKGTDVWFSPRCNIDLPCDWKGEQIMAYKLYSIANQCDGHEDDEYPDFYRILPANKECIQTRSPVSTDKYTSTHECSGKDGLLQLTQYPSVDSNGDALAADQRCTASSTAALSIATGNCAGSVSPLGTTDSNTSMEPKSVDFYIPVNKLTCNPELLEFFKDCPLPQWVWYLVCVAVVAAVGLVVLLFAVVIPRCRDGRMATGMTTGFGGKAVGFDTAMHVRPQMHKLNPLVSQSKNLGPPQGPPPSDRPPPLQPVRTMSKLAPPPSISQSSRSLPPPDDLERPSLAPGNAPPKLQPPPATFDPKELLPPFDPTKYPKARAAAARSFA